MPGLVVDGLPDGAQDAQRGPVVLLWPRVAVSQEQAQSRRGAVEVGDAQSLDGVPVPAWKRNEGLHLPAQTQRGYGTVYQISVKTKDDTLVTALRVPVFCPIVSSTKTRTKYFTE